MASISYFAEDTPFQITQKRSLTTWIKQTILDEGYQLELLNFIFCSDNYLLSINKQYLDHDYYTDIITFEQSEDPSTIEGDIFISIDRVKENAVTFNTEFSQELSRVMIHGVLHLCGYMDHTPEEKALMRDKESYYLNILSKKHST
ncbi:rRNA maturation RNase YbeY [Cytophagaceae bacterium DM2B3-1]|uniref:Endoribonuclease YbeY n=1 Tax=Xanthocytophaga flava TaxID=3048013 RepID=A0ABT7CEN0_9BACT|nr:rRNA maturation RNase YbeY [Xanthocytophaga flavus]MDJ1491991.1 rRNA maturation RNase YbeY [Xanthocytophaga flavus]